MNDDATLHDDQLKEMARHLGARAAERLDVERTAQAVVARLRVQPPRSTAGWVRMRPVWLKVAAVVVVLLAWGLLARGTREPPTMSALIAPMGEDLSDLTAEQLRDAMRSLEEPLLGETAGAPDTGLDGLDAHELRTLLHALEG
jgi:hypothetical protein